MRRSGTACTAHDRGLRVAQPSQAQSEFLHSNCLSSRRKVISVTKFTWCQDIESLTFVEKTIAAVVEAVFTAVGRYKASEEGKSESVHDWKMHYEYLELASMTAEITNQVCCRVKRAGKIL